MCNVVKKNMFQNLPTELLHIIWGFAYNFRLDRDPWTDLLLILDIQESIPACFLRDRLPMVRMTDLETRLGHLWQICPLSPFKKGYPYLPSESIDQMSPMPWSQLAGEIFYMLSRSGVHNLKTYRRVLNRKYNQHLNRNVFEWNDSFKDLFGDVRLCQLENYNLSFCKSWLWEFKHVVLWQLSKAKFLTTV